VRSRTDREHASAACERADQEAGEVCEQCDAGRGGRKRHPDREPGEHERRQPARDVDERGEAAREPVRRDEIAQQGEDGTAGTEDAGRRRDGDDRQRREGTRQDELGNAGDRAGDREEDVKAKPRGRPRDRPAEDEQSEAVREQVAEAAVGVDARDDRPRVGRQRRREDEQRAHYARERRDSLGLH